MEKLQFTPDENGIVNLHGRKEIEDFFRDQCEDDKALRDAVILFLNHPDGTKVGLVSEYHVIVDGSVVRKIIPQKAKAVIVHHKDK